MSVLQRLAIAFALWLIALAPAGAVERILSFVSDVAVERNGDLDVTETIRVQAEGNQIRHGILRDFPTIYTRNDGTRVEVGFTVQSVTRDGGSENWTLEGLSNGVRVRIGSADATVSNGPHTYVIKYVTTRQIGFFADYDELYWNATGTGWTFPIDQAEARIALPSDVPLKQTSFYTGAQGARGQDATIVEQKAGHIVFRTTRGLPAHAGLTVAAAWDKGVVDAPTASQKASYWLEDNSVVAVAILGALIVLGFYAFAWQKVGRDPPSGTIIPLFGPPQGMSPSAARYVDRMSFDDRCFAAAVIDLGVNGHLKITGSGTQSVIFQRDGGHAITADETAVENKLFALANSVALTQSNHERLGKAKEALEEKLQQAYLGKLWKNNYNWSGFGFGLLVLVYVAVAITAGLAHRSDLLTGLGLGWLFSGPVVMLAGWLIFAAFQSPKGRIAALIGGVIVLLIGIGIGCWLILTETGRAGVLPSLAFYVAALVCGGGFILLKAPSKAGRKAMDDIEGFRQYLGVAEEDRLDALNPPDKTPELFEKFLPYAVALDCHNAWAKRFAGVLAAAGTAAVVNSWYQSDQAWNDDPVAFADHLGGELTSTISSASTAPGSDSGGSSGGGSSGGGGGGGGGSGW
jgi:uncharacterized membrane protein YgcG